MHWKFVATMNGKGQKERTEMKAMLKVLFNIDRLTVIELVSPG